MMMIFGMLMIYGILGYTLRHAPDDYPDFHKKNPYRSYNGFHFHLHSLEITNENWDYIREMGSKTVGVAGMLYIISTILCFFIIPERIFNIVIGITPIFYMICAFYYIIKKAKAYKK